MRGLPDYGSPSARLSSQSVTLQYFEFMNRTQIERGFLLRGRFETHEDHVSQDLVLTLRASMLGRECWKEETTEKDRDQISDEVLQSESVPASWWDATLLRFVPKRWQRGRLAPKMRAIVTQQKKVYQTVRHQHRHFKLCPYLGGRESPGAEVAYLRWVAEDGPVSPDPEAQAWRTDARERELKHLREFYKHTTGMPNPFDPEGNQ